MSRSLPGQEDRMELAQRLGQIIAYPEAGGWEGKGWYDGVGAVSLGQRRSGSGGYCLRIPGSWAAADPGRRRVRQGAGFL